MNIELRNVHFSERMSDETNCFSAIIYVDGKRKGEVLNHGTGGPHEYGFDTKELDAWAATLPPTKTEFGDIRTDLDVIVDDLFSEWLKKKDFERMTKKGLQTVFKLKGDKDGEFRVVKCPFGPAIKARMLEKYADKIEYFLNERGSL